VNFLKFFQTDHQHHNAKAVRRTELPTSENWFVQSASGLDSIPKMSYPSDVQGGEGWGECPPPPPIRFFQSFQKIYSKGLKLSVAVLSFSAEFLIRQLCVHHFDVAMATIIGLATKSIFLVNSALFSSFPHQIADIHEFVHFISILA